MKLRLMVVMFCIAFVISGCISSKSYVDNSYKKSKIADIIPAKTPKKATVVVEFQRNGEPQPSAVPFVKAQIVKTLTWSRVFEPVDNTDANVDKLFFTMNNIADLENATKQGFKTGFTFGGAGSVVSDNYAFTGKLIPVKGKEFKGEYKHALHTAIGNTDAPQGLTPAVSIEAGINEIIEDLVLNFLKDYQASIK
ncbi:MAG: hypothetical protein ABFD50_11325 [Smithella sp.]